MLNVGGGELVVIALIALIALGPEQLPSVMRKLGALSAQLRSVTTGLKDEFMSGLDRPPNGQPPRTTFDPDQPIVPRGYAEQRRREQGSGDDERVDHHQPVDGHGDAEGGDVGSDADRAP
jgi:Sec-independent protein translocase protein TatA